MMDTLDGDVMVDLLTNMIMNLMTTEVNKPAYSILRLEHKKSLFCTVNLSVHLATRASNKF